MDNLYNKLIPIKCTLCGNISGTVICDQCTKELRTIYDVTCIICGKNSIFGTTHIFCMKKTSPDFVFSIYKYGGMIRECIRKAKYKQKEFMALKYITQYGARECINSGFSISSNSLLIPIPLNKYSYKDRGFNQAEIIAKQLASSFTVKMLTNVLIRTKNTKKQFAKNRADRFANLSNAFKVVNVEKLRDRKIILVDDITTSGATFIEATQQLKLCGASSVGCIALAKKDLDKLDKHQK